MIRRGFLLAFLCLAVPLSSAAQVSNSAQADIIRAVHAEEAAAGIDMPLGGEGVQLSDNGQINQEKLRKQIQKNGRSIQSGRVVTVTHIGFNVKSIEIELDGGGKDKKGFRGRVQISVGAGAPPSQNSSGPKSRGSKVSQIGRAHV